MFAVLAVACFTVALILHLAGHGAAQYVTDFTLGGLICLAAQSALGASPIVLRRKD